MSDRVPVRILQRGAVAIAILASLVLPHSSSAQSIDEWRARERAALAATTQAVRALESARNRAQDFDAQLVAGGRTVRYLRENLTSRDSAAIADGLEVARTRLVERFGESGAALIDSLEWSAERDGAMFGSVLRIGPSRAGGPGRTILPAPASAEDIARVSLAAAGDALRRRTPALASYSAYSAFRPREEVYQELARRLATSWAASGRQCANGVVDACATVLAPFDAATAIDHHFEPVDYPAVIAAGRLPANSDSIFYVARRRCLDRRDMIACASIVHSITSVDPFNDEVRGSLLTHAFELGGRDAITRLVARANAPPLEALAHAAGVPQDSLLRSWHARTTGALADLRRRVDPPILVASVVWIGILLAVSTRRRFL